MEDYKGDRVCSILLYEETLGNFGKAMDWETRAICEIVNTGISNDLISGWVAYKNPKRYKKYGSQKGWERINRNKLGDSDFLQLTERKAEQMKLPFLESSG